MGIVCKWYLLTNFNLDSSQSAAMKFWKLRKYSRIAHNVRKLIMWHQAEMNVAWNDFGKIYFVVVFTLTWGGLLGIFKSPGLPYKYDIGYMTESTARHSLNFIKRRVCAWTFASDSFFSFEYSFLSRFVSRRSLYVKS